MVDVGELSPDPDGEDGPIAAAFRRGFDLGEQNQRILDEAARQRQRSAELTPRHDLPSPVVRWECTEPGCYYRINNGGTRSWWTNDDIRIVLPMVRDHMMGHGIDWPPPLFLFQLPGPDWPVPPPPPAQSIGGGGVNTPPGGTPPTPGGDGTWRRSPAGGVYMQGWRHILLATPMQGTGGDLWVIGVCPRCSACVGGIDDRDYWARCRVHEQWHATTDHPIPAELTTPPPPPPIDRGQ